MLGRFLLILCLAFAAVVAVVGFNTVTYTSLQIEVAPVEPVAIDSQAAAERLAHAVTFPTISHMDPSDFDPAPFAALNAFLRDRYPKVHETMTLETVSEYSLLYTWTGTDETLKPIVLCAHTDVVPVAPGTEDRWVRGAYDFLIEEEYIWGRGTLDDKVNVLALLEAAELLIAQGIEPKRTVIFAFGHDEEIGGDLGAVKMAELLRERGVEAEFVLDEGGAIVSNVIDGVSDPVATIGIAEKGYLSLGLTVEAEGGHSSQPPKETAVGILAKAVHRVETNQMPASIVGVSAQMFSYIGPEMPLAQRIALSNLWLTEDIVISMLSGSTALNAMLRTTTAPTILQAGVKDNVLPAVARAVINFRILPGDTVESVIAHVNNVVQDERVVVEPVEWGSEPSNVSSIEAPSFALMQKTVKQVFPGTVTAPFLVVAGTDARHYEIISDNVYRFSPLQLDADDLARIHGVNERVGVENYANIIRFFRQLILNAAVE